LSGSVAARRYQKQAMSSLHEQDPLNPNDPEFYAPPLLRERAAKLGRSLSQEARSEPIKSSPISRPASLQNQDNDALWNTLAPEVMNEPARLASWDRRTAQLAVAAAVAGVVTVTVLLFLLMKPAPPQSVGLTSSDITGAMSAARAQSVAGDAGSKPALEEFRTLLASPPSQPATQERSEQLLLRFLQWHKKANTTETTQ
jgi:hypothetical protein